MNCSSKILHWCMRPWTMACVLSLLVLVCGCDGNIASDGKPTIQYGALSLDLDFQSRPDAGASTTRVPAAVDPDICTDFNIDTIRAEVFWPDGRLVKDATWECRHHLGIIDKIPPGTGFSVVCTGNVQGQPLWRGEVGTIDVVAGQTTTIEHMAVIYSGSDQTPPALAYSIPGDGTTGVAVNTSIVAAFGEPLAASSISDQSFVVTSGGTPVPGRIEFQSGNDAISFHPDGALTPLATYSVTLDANMSDTTGIMDRAGNVCDQDYQWTFTVGGAADETAPRIVGTTPASDADQVDPYASVSAVFDEPINPALVSADHFTLVAGQTLVAGRLSYDQLARTLTFTPDVPLDPLTQYEAMLGSGIMDMAGNPLPQPAHTWTFRTMAPQFSVSVSKSGDGAGTITSVPAGIQCGEQCTARFAGGTTVTLTVEADTTSVFQGWSGISCDGATCELRVDEDRTLTADLAWKTYTIEAVAGAGGTISPAGSVTVRHDDGATFQFSPDQGYYLAAVTVDGSAQVPSNGYAFLQVRENHAIEAVFKPVSYVDQQASSSGNGQTWGTAFQSIQEAINLAQAGDEIWVRQGAYALSAPIVVDKELTIRGGFDMTEIYLEQRIQTRRTTLDGNRTVGCMRVTAEARIDNIIFNNGTSANGGGLNCSAPAHLENCTFSNCTADNGGGIYSTRQLNLIDCEFLNDQALTGSGGAIFIQGTENNRAGLNLSGCRFEDNVSWWDDYHLGGLFGGGAIFSNYSNALIISDSSFARNRAFDGGAIYMVNGDTASIEACQFDGNNARDPSGMGGAVYDKDCLLQVSDSTFTDNGAFDGGAIYTHPSARTSHGISMISHSQFSGNGSPGAGAAVHIAEGNFRVVNSLFYDNDGLCAGALCAQDVASLDVVNCTIVNNHGDMGGISATTRTTVLNSILWGNQSNTNPNLAQVTPGMAVQFSDIDQDDLDGINGNIRVTPGFANAQEKNFRLAEGSQCVDKGDNDAAFLPSLDLDGRSRIIGSAVDMGVYEQP